VLGQVDDIAERATALGSDVEGTVRIAAQASRVPE
jgi:DNA-binding ferritin-like protein